MYICMLVIKMNSENKKTERIVKMKDLDYIEDEFFYALVCARERGDVYLSTRMYEAIKKIREIKN